MTVIICSGCDRTIEHYKAEKMATLYGSCAECRKKRLQKL
ncbi:DNA-directed RNA polymerase subunit RPC12/RpoP [Geomicrobium halophilum]|uniref:DNA-directed RNA polymerase subunit RPC12/RpoP n=1 Tax=Geomicrobium halophilum TaxID=549000 RepID=A0A841PKZ2_9BACL|nr:GapA-binding peptide SR1P [Geomicrobium halophilum]MBB6449440.1 DNA-directed RNA polymerase subunit RPC12/RpoP [Geomicrobium halophilum]